MVRHHFRLICGLLLLSAVGCRSSSATSSSLSQQPLAGIVSPENPRGTPKAAVALYIPGRTTDSDTTPPVAPPATLVFGGEPRPALPDLPTLPPLPTGEPPVAPPPLVMPPPALSPPVSPPLPAADSPLLALYSRAVKEYAAMDSYIMRLKRREVVNGTARPEEVMLGKIRKAPFSVYFKWLGPEGKGREVVYVKGQHDNLIHSLTATGDVLFLPGGKRFKVAPDSFLVKAKSRNSITEAGVGSMIDRFGRLVEALQTGDTREGTAKYLGELKRPEFDNQVAGVEQTIPPKSDSPLPKGGQRLWFFDTTTGLPVLLITHDETGREVEYYCYDRFILPAILGDDDFNPDLLWKTDP